MSWLLAGAACVAIGSSYLTMALLAETEPYENEDGEEEYTLAGYLLLGGAYVAKWFIRKIFGHPKKVVKNYDNVIMFNPMPVEEEDDDDENNELVV